MTDLHVLGCCMLLCSVGAAHTVLESSRCHPQGRGSLWRFALAGLASRELWSLLTVSNTVV